MFARSKTIMSREDPDAAEILTKQFIKEGITVLTEVKLNSISQEILMNTTNTSTTSSATKPSSDVPTSKSVKITINYAMKGGQVVSSEFTHVLIATGRSPIVSSLNLEAAGVRYDTTNGVRVNDHLESSNPNIFAVGDVCSEYKFTHMADAMARMVVRNALFFGSDKVSQLVIPWCTFTTPEIAHVGPYPQDLLSNNVKFDVYKVAFEENDRAVLEGCDEGFVKVYVLQGTDKVIAGTICGEGAGNMISEITVLITQNIGLMRLAAVIHPYPTMADAVRKTGDLYNRTRLTTFVKVLFRKLLAARR